MKKYILVRLIRSIFSLFVVVVLTFTMIYTLIPRDRVFGKDPTYNKLKKQDDKASYINTKMESLGYLDFVEQKDVCVELYGSQGDKYMACVEGKDTAAMDEYFNTKANEGWDVKQYTNGSYYMTKDVPLVKRILNLFANMVQIDHPWKVQDPNNPNLERKYYIEQGPNGIPALACSGCESKYQFYVNSSFPFLHTNAISFDLGTSYPTFQNVAVLDVIGQSQGNAKKFDVTFPSGVTQSASVDLYTCEYKPTLDVIEQSKFGDDHYANCVTVKEEPSMVTTSFLLGILSLIISYVIALPLGVYMASKKDKLADKLGMAYIIFTIAVPSLAYIYLFRYIGTSVFQLPGKFPTYGSGDPRSYVLPLISLSIPMVGSLLMWCRRYMIDQSTQDYVKFARAKGLSQGEIYKNHILRNAIIPLAHGIPSSIILSITGALITETVYSIPGMGKMLPDSLTSFNNPMIVALTFIFTALAIFSVLAGDILITFIDPRISLDDKGGRK